MTCVTLALLDKVDDRLRKRMDDSTVLQDYLIDKAGVDFLLATTEREQTFEGVEPVQLCFQERDEEGLLALIADKPVDYSLPAYRIYADPFNTPGLVDDQQIADGFTLKAGRAYHMPEDSLMLLRALKDDAKVTSAYRRGGFPSAVLSDRILLARHGPYHPRIEDILRPFPTRMKGGVKIHTLPFTVKNGKITVDNTFKPKTVKLKE